jgi:triosephosphate isomerase
LENRKRDIAIRITVNICRFILAFTFIFSGFVKAIDPLGFQYKLQDYLEAFGMGGMFPDFVSLFIGMAVSITEFTIGVCMFLGIRRHVATFGALLMMVVMTPLTLYLAIANPVHDCGCFGDAVTLTNWQTFGKNIVLFIAAVTSFVWRKYIIDFISPKTEWIVSLYSLLYAFCLSVYCLNTLPIFDFRPFKIGTDLRQATSLTSDTNLPDIETTFIMEKDGVRREFTAENYPDSTWRYIDRHTVVKGSDTQSSINDFSIIIPESDEDITQDVLDKDGYTFLLIANRLAVADDSYIDLINEIYDYSVENGYGFYCLTASNNEDIEMWRDRTGAEYPFYAADDITLKTVIRSNPGLLLIKDGIIINKWADSELPDEYMLNDRLEKIRLGQIDDTSRWNVTLKLCLWFFIPLLLVVWLDIKLKWEQPKIHDINHLKISKMRKNIVAGNWKMNKSLQEGIALAKELNDILVADKPNCDVIICTPFIHLASVTPIVDQAVIGVGAENCADKEAGAYTGEVSASMVASTGAKYVILGHSERRAYYGETVEILSEKVKLALANGLTPIFCIGEVLEEREANKQNEVVAAQLASVFSLSAADFSKIILAYEPVWAIGTGKTATAAQAQEIHAFIRSLIVEKYGKEVAENTSILYGGSCKPSNAKELFANPDVDGGLIGGAALKAADFKGIIDAFKA